LEIFTTLLLYFSIQITGDVVNVVQSHIGKFIGSNNQFLNFVQSDITVTLSYYILIVIIGVIIGEVSRYFRKIWFQSLHFANKQELNNHRATLDVAKFRSKEYDDLSKRIDELPASWQTRIFFSDAMFGLFTTIISFAIFGMSLVFYEPIYAIILVLTAIPMAITEFNLVAKWWKLFQELVPKHKKRHILEKPYNNSNSFVQALMFNQMPTLREQIKENTDSVLRSYTSIRKLTLRKLILSRLIGILGLSLVIIYSIWIIVTKGGSIGAFTIVLAAAKTFQGNLSSIVSIIADQWNSAQGVILIEKEFLGLKPIVHTDYAVIPRFDLTPTIKVENLSFKYPDTEVLVLKNINFEIKPGSKVAIVGKSGNGKSTLQALLMRHYDPTSGAIFAGGVNLRNIEPKVWNNVASALTQDYTILWHKIREEIASSRPDLPIDLGSVIASSKFANFDEVVDSLLDGYESQIGLEMGGCEFSGGEKQRLALARVRYRGTPILILDEPDAKLDPESAEQVMNQVFALAGVTVIIITHHVSRAERCDNIIVMGKGEVAEQGTHRELMALEGLYYSMYHKDRERLGFESDPES
jgi:ATP-binding cassette subfamily B protein